jgi:hypothetical protein
MKFGLVIPGVHQHGTGSKLKEINPQTSEPLGLPGLVYTL